MRPSPSTSYIENRAEQTLSHISDNTCPANLRFDLHFSHSQRIQQLSQQTGQNSAPRFHQWNQKLMQCGLLAGSERELLQYLARKWIQVTGLPGMLRNCSYEMTFASFVNWRNLSWSLQISWSGSMQNLHWSSSFCHGRTPCHQLQFFSLLLRQLWLLKPWISIPSPNYWRNIRSHVSNPSRPAVHWFICARLFAECDRKCSEVNTKTITKIG